MIVPPEMLQEIVQSLQAAPAGPADHRREARVKVRTHVSIVVRTGDGVQAVQVQVRDISAGGVGIFRTQSMPLDEPFVALLPRTGQDPTAVLSQVAYWEPLAERLFGIGCRFLRILTPAEVQDVRTTLARAAALAQSLDMFADEPRRATA